MDSPGCCRNGHGIPDARIPDSNWQSNPVRLSYIFGYRMRLYTAGSKQYAFSDNPAGNGGKQCESDSSRKQSPVPPNVPGRIQFLLRS